MAAWVWSASDGRTHAARRRWLWEPTWWWRLQSIRSLCESVNLIPSLRIVTTMSQGDYRILFRSVELLLLLLLNQSCNRKIATKQLRGCFLRTICGLQKSSFEDLPCYSLLGYWLKRPRPLVFMQRGFDLFRFGYLYQQHPCVNAVPSTIYRLGAPKPILTIRCQISAGKWFRISGTVQKHHRAN